MFEADEESKECEFLKDLCIKALTKPFSEKSGINLSMNDLFSLLPSKDNYHYQGSLTTPGYDEIVQWFLFTEPIKIPQSQMDILESFWKNEKYDECVKGNARHIQKLGSRIVHKITHTAGTLGTWM